MARQISTFLMFEGGVAAEAMRFYVSLFEDAEVLFVEPFPPGEHPVEGALKRASFRLGEHRLMCFDSPIGHAFTFTPSMSLFVECESAIELDRLFEQLAVGGSVMMPVGDYGFSQRFGWVSDRFGVSWQLNVA